MDDIHGLKPFMLFAPNARLLLAVAVAFVATWLFIRWWRSRKAQSATPDVSVLPVSTTKTALGWLDELVARRQQDQNRPREFHGAISALLRAYLTARYDFPARRMTSSEILAMPPIRALDLRTMHEVTEVLTACDLAKFANAKPLMVDMEASLAALRSTITTLGDAPLSGLEDEFAGRATGVLTLPGGGKPA